MENEIEMPTPCQRCGEIFDLNDGIESEKWYPNTVICEDCAENEQDEIENDLSIERLTIGIRDANFDIKQWFHELKSFGVDTTELLNIIKNDINNL